jgi:hypothetical protein
LEQHIRVVAIIHIILGALGLVAAIAVFALGLGSGLMSGDPDAAIAGGTCGTIIAVIIGVLSLPSIIAGLGLQKRKEWARILTIILSVLNLFNVPIGTAIGAYSMWALLDARSKEYFSG